MATSSSSALDLILCFHCTEVFTDPCQLPCGDIICRQCFMTLKQVVSKDAQKQLIRLCPQCNRASRADGSELKSDARTAWIVKMSQENEPRQGKNAQQVEMGKCTLPNCTKPAVGSGIDYESPLCQLHLSQDAAQWQKNLDSLRQQVDQLLNPLKRQAKSKRAALNELQNERCETSDLFDEIIERLQTCRKQTLARLDATIETLQGELATFQTAEQLESNLQLADLNRDQKSSHQLIKKLKLFLSESSLGSDECWSHPMDSTVSIVKNLLSTVQNLSADVEIGSWSCVQWSKPRFTNLYSSREAPCSMEVCSHTEGFYERNHMICKGRQLNARPLPDVCVVAWFSDMIVYFYDAFTSGNRCGCFALKSRRTLVSAHCASHLQRLYLLLSDSSLLVTDLAGTQLHEVVTLQVERALCVTGSGEKIYILGSNGQLVILSAESAEIQERVQLPDEVKGAIGVAVIGQRLVLMSKKCVFLFNQSNRFAFKMWSVESQQNGEATDLLQVTSVGYGFVAVFGTEGTGWILAQSGMPILEVPDALFSCCFLSETPMVARQEDSASNTMLLLSIAQFSNSPRNGSRSSSGENLPADEVPTKRFHFGWE